MENKEYEIKVDPKILKFLGPTLYTNIYYVLAELIANAYDANAHNVYIIDKGDAITVEDDGNGMSYETDVKKYLDVATETRTNKEDEYVEGSNQTRRKLGRKGIGKLAALSVSDKVLVKTKNKGDLSGFILTSELPKGNRLPPLSAKEITFERVGGDHGTSIVMTNPVYELHDRKDTVKKNLLKILPLINEDFKIHIKLRRANEFTIDKFDPSLIKDLVVLITLGDDFHSLSKFFKHDSDVSEEQAKNLLRQRPAIRIPLKRMRRKDGALQDYDLEIRGWIGALKSTRERRLNIADFPDNFLSVISNGKLGNFNIIPEVSKNKLQEVYVVGQLHVDLFEESDLPDMALSNRQSYKSQDRRYDVFLGEIGEKLLPEIVAMRNTWAKYKNAEKEKEKLLREKEREEKLRSEVVKFQETAAKQLAEDMGGTKEEKELNQRIFEKRLAGKNIREIFGLKGEVDDQKKKVLISHAKCDITFANIIEKMLIFNNVPTEDILYTGSENIESQIPEVSLLDYLRIFFIDSMSNRKLAVIYVTGERMSASWYPVLEVGGVWIAGGFHKVFNIRTFTPITDKDSGQPYSPKKPLDLDTTYQDSAVDYDSQQVTVDTIQFNRFIMKIRDFCIQQGYAPRSEEDNKTELARHVIVF